MAFVKLYCLLLRRFQNIVGANFAKDESITLDLKREAAMVVNPCFPTVGMANDFLGMCSRMSQILSEKHEDAINFSLKGDWQPLILSCK